MKLLVCGIILAVVSYFIKKNKEQVNEAYKQTNIDSFDEVSNYVDKEELPYRKNRYLLSKAEYNFYKVLSMAVESEDLYICPKDRLADIVYISNTPKRQTYWNKIKSKHIDFLICKKDFLNPLLVIELDDSSHNRKDRMERDKFVDEAMESAGVPMLRIKVNEGYKPNELNFKINELLRNKQHIS